MTYAIRLRKQALKELEHLPKLVTQKISAAIEELATNPRPKGSKKLKGEQEYLWRIHIGDYRVIYAIEDVIKVIDVRKIGHRREIYD
jgi:mRNA interferase RelE/StbE